MRSWAFHGGLNSPDASHRTQALVGAAAILSSLHTAMGRKSAIVENAYAFALRQQQIMIRDDKVMMERESIERVEELLQEEARANRQRGRKTAEEVVAWSKAVAADGGRGLQQGGKDEESKDHWIARELLQMSEQAWQRVLEGGGTDAIRSRTARAAIPTRSRVARAGAASWAG